MKERVREYAPDIKSLIYIIMTIGGLFGYDEYVRPNNKSEISHTTDFKDINVKLDELRDMSRENNINIYNISALLSTHINDKDIHIPRGEFDAVTDNLQRDVDGAKKAAENAERKIDNVIYGSKQSDVK